MPAPLRHFPPERPASGQALLIFPGGNSLHAPHEGGGNARHFAAAGVDCHVVAYPHSGDGIRHPQMIGAALRRAGVSFEFHAYARGRHGLGLETPSDSSRACIRWMRDRP